MTRSFIDPDKKINDNAKIKSLYNIKFKRSSAVSIPAGAVGEITSASDKVLSISKPSDDSLNSSLIVVCPDFKIESNNIFYGSLLPNKPIPVYYDPSGGVPTVGGTVGTIADSWLVSAANTGFRVIWVDASLERVWVIYQ